MEEPRTMLRAPTYVAPSKEGAGECSRRLEGIHGLGDNQQLGLSAVACRVYLRARLPGPESRMMPPAPPCLARRGILVHETVDSYDALQIVTLH